MNDSSGNEGLGSEDEAGSRSGWLARACATAATLVICACGPRVEAELPDVVVTQREVEIPGWPASQLTSEPSLTVTYVQDNVDTGLPRKAYSAVEIREIIVEARAGVTDLSFIRRLRISLADASRPNDPSGTVEIGRYDRPTGAAVGSVLSIPRDPPADVLRPWRAASNIVIVEVAGALPVERWSVDVGVRASATLTYE